MSAMRPPGKKTGNNTLIFIAGGLALVLLILILVGMGRQSTIDQLLMSAAPDSSGYVPDSTQSLPADEPTAENLVPLPEEPKKDSAETVTIKTDTVSKTMPAGLPVVESTSDGADKVFTYTIRKGDTMYKIAAKFGNKPADVMALNGLTDMSLQADKPIKVKIKAVHTVAESEGLLAIGEKYGVPVKSIKIANDLTSEVLSSGTSLLIPLK